MLGGYYLGQTYLGVSGWTGSGLLSVQNTNHGHTSDNIALVQQHFIVVNNTSHSLTSQVIDLIEHKLLSVSPTNHSLVSDVINLIQKHILATSNSLHGLTSDNIVLLQKHTLSVANSTHSHTVDGNLVLDQYFLLNQPDPGVFLVTSPEIWIVQHHTLAIENTIHTLTDNLSRVINWADYGYFAGIFIKDFNESGDLLESGASDTGTLILKNKNIGSFEPTQIDSGVFIKSTDKQGQLN